MIMLIFLLASAWGQSVDELQRQLLLEAEAAHAANMERLSVSPDDCLISLRQQTRLKTLRANVVTLEKMGGLTHCSEVTDSDPASESHKLWLAARRIEKGAGATAEKLDQRKMWGATKKQESAETFVRPQAPVPEKRAPRPKRSTGPVPLQNKKCEILVLSGQGSGLSNTVPTIESCEELCDTAKEKGASVRCYYGDENITNAPPAN
jgi:hypothetical protein